ncbi:MAG: hypothetical protein GY835_26480 [bacterium]|nr:hypothetical protein [bacterium]
MKILLLGTGMQGKAALHDLVQNPYVKEITAADRDLSSLREHVTEMGYDEKLLCEHLDAGEPTYLDHLMQDPDVVIDLLPEQYSGSVAEAALRNGVHLVNSNNTCSSLRNLADRAVEANITLMPECGMSPGLDLILLSQAVSSFDSVTDVHLYSGGVPEPEAADNPLKYKITWTLDGVLDSYLRPAHLIRNDTLLDIPAGGIFAAEYTHELTIEGLDTFEAYPNGNALVVAEKLGLNARKLINMGCYTLRWPGHCNLWRTLIGLGMLDGLPTLVDGRHVNRQHYLTSLIEPQLTLGDKERDIVVVRVEVKGVREGKRTSAVLQVIDRRDMETGFTAMSRTAGFSAAIIAKMVASGEIARRGLLSPLEDIPFEAYMDELATRNIAITSEFTDLE